MARLAWSWILLLALVARPVAAAHARARLQPPRLPTTRDGELFGVSVATGGGHVVAVSQVGGVYEVDPRRAAALATGGGGAGGMRRVRDQRPGNDTVALFACTGEGTALACAAKLTLTPPPELGAAYDERYSFGPTLALSADATLLAVGVYALDSSYRGGVAVYKLDAADAAAPWTAVLLDLVVAPNYRDNFGLFFALDGTALVVGAPDTDDPGTGSDVGAVYVYDCSGTATDPPSSSACVLAATLQHSPRRSYDSFGLSVAISGGLVAVGSTVSDEKVASTDGRVHLWHCDRPPAAAWNCVPAAVIAAPPEYAPDESWSTYGFAAKLAIDGDILAVSCAFTPRYCPAGLPTAFVYNCSANGNSSTSCELQAALAPLTPSDVEDYFTVRPAVAVRGSAVAVGHPERVAQGGVPAVVVYTCDRSARPWACALDATLAVDPADVTNPDASALGVGVAFGGGLWLAATAPLAIARGELPSGLGVAYAFPFAEAGDRLSFPCASTRWEAPACTSCIPDHFGPTCTACSVCNEHGTCIGAPAADGSCACDAGWAGDACTECAIGYSGAACDTCVAGFYGPSCKPCALCEQHGRCVDGRDGACLCDAGWAEPDCVTCLPGFDPDSSCTECLAGHFGPACDPCSACINGACEPGIGGRCACEPNYGGPFCDTEPCAVTAGPWRAQYTLADASAALVEEVLTLSADGQLAQNITAFPFQDCAQNWAAWTGTYTKTNATALSLNFVRCTLGGSGCVRCTNSRSESASFLFANECARLDITFAAATTPISYYSHLQKS